MAVLLRDGTNTLSESLVLAQGRTLAACLTHASQAEAYRVLRKVMYG